MGHLLDVKTSAEIHRPVVTAFMKSLLAPKAPLALRAALNLEHPVPNASRFRDHGAMNPDKLFDYLEVEK